MRMRTAALTTAITAATLAGSGCPEPPKTVDGGPPRVVDAGQAQAPALIPVPDEALAPTPHSKPVHPVVHSRH